ncbi:hypothetical protein D6C77_00829 [Aureobasidium pullulans]|nr:hypothetical protein D6C97_00434 [Aureobasidium pullulans]TIA65316.1 hypothetical protein D6C77_00829 [Aureobasidium pullulans]
MDNHYYPMNPMGAGYYPNGQPIAPPEGMMPEGVMMPDGYVPRLYQLPTISQENLNSYSDIEDPSRGSISQQGGSRGGKRRSVTGADHVKHRRTRSGCFTCRQRRVKCDEAHPTCERCRKGKRECHYPEATTGASSKPSKNYKNKGSAGEASNSSGDEYDVTEADKLPSIPDDEENEEATSSLCSKDDRKLSDASSNSRDQSPLIKSPATTDSSITSARPTTRPQIPRQSSRKSLKSKQPPNSKWAHLPKDVKFYITYHREKLTHQHYAMKYDSGDFLKTTFLEIALGYEPLLYAITAFSAYHHTLMKPDGKLQSFLGYYNKSVSLLRQSLERSPRHTVATLLTILQLATFEEFLGDWVNLMGHQRAAYEILTELFTPQTIMQSETHRKIISWYIRFDLFAGFMHGYGMVLSRDWHVACMEFYVRQARDKPRDLGSVFEEKFARSRLLATDISLLFARGKKEGPSMELITEMGKLNAQLEGYAHDLENAFKDTRTYVKEFPNAPKGDWDDVVNSTDPEFLLAGELFTWNFILIDFWAIHLLFKSQVAQFDPTVGGEEVVATAFKVCKMFEALQYCGENSTAMILGAQASLGMAAACMPKDQRHTMWCRNKYALIEQCGYIYPAALRQRMTGVWGVDVMRWWLPNDEGYFPILQAVREFIDYRARVPQDNVQSDLRDMKGLFSALQLDDTDSKKGTGSQGGTDSSDPFDFDAQGSMPWESSPEMNWP